MRSLTAALLALLLLSGVLAGQTPPRTDSARLRARLDTASSLARSGRLGDAPKVAERARLSGARDSLRAALRASAAYRRAGRFEHARAALAAVKLDPLVHVELVNEREDALAAIEAEKKAAASPFRDGLSAIPGTLRADLSTVVVTAVRLGAYFLTAGLFFWGVSLLLRLRRPRPGLVLEMDDRTAPAGTDVRGANRALASEFRRELAAVSGAARGSLLDNLEDLDGVQVPGLVAENPILQRIEASIGDNASVPFGPLVLNPRQVLAFFASLLARPHELTLKGCLVPTASGGVVLSAVRIDAGKKTEEGAREWSASGTGESARQAAIREMVLRYAFDNATVRPTDRWESFAACRRGIEALATGEGRSMQEVLNSACSHFECAVRADPLNWIVRMHLADTLRKKGRNADALVHYRHVAAMLERPMAPLATFLEHAPDFPWTVRYNIAATFAKLPNPGAHEKALRLFEEQRTMLAGPKAVEELGPERHGQMRILVESAIASALATRVENLYEARNLYEWERAGELDRETVGQAERQIRSILESVRGCAGRGGEVDRGVHCLCSAMVYNALSRVLHLKRDCREALRYAREAANCSPALADPYIGVAAALFKLRAEEDPQWERRAEEALVRALELSPGNSKAQYYLGLLALERFDHATAEAHFGAADPPHPWTLYRHARVVVETGPGLDRAIPLVRRSIKMLPRPDERYLFLASCVAELAATGEKTVAEELLSEARLRVAEVMARCAEVSQLRERAEVLAERLKGTPSRAAFPLTETFVRELLRSRQAQPDDASAV